ARSTTWPAPGRARHRAVLAAGQLSSGGARLVRRGAPRDQWQWSAAERPARARAYSATSHTGQPSAPRAAVGPGRARRPTLLAAGTQPTDLAPGPRRRSPRPTTTTKPRCKRHIPTHWIGDRFLPTRSSVHWRC